MNTIVKTFNFHLRKIYRTRRFITVDSCHQLVHSLILSRLDYANSLLYGIAAKDKRKLQKLQNKVAKVILGVTDFILLRPWEESFTGYQLMRESSSKCCS